MESLYACRNAACGEYPNRRFLSAQCPLFFLAVSDGLEYRDNPSAHSSWSFSVCLSESPRDFQKGRLHCLSFNCIQRFFGCLARVEYNTSYARLDTTGTPWD